jgi:hypothetical protein
MSRKFRVGIVALLVVGALSVAMTGTALAQEETPTPAPFAGHGFARGIGGQVGLEAAAEALGMTADELSTQLWGGKTLADLAEAAGIDLQDVRDAIEQAVEDGTLTREHADWLLQGLDNGYLGGHGFGHFGGHPGFRGFGGLGMPGVFQNSTPSSTETDL